MKTAIERLRRKLSQWLAQQRLLRRRKLHVLRLEDRRLPDATFGATLGALTLGGFDGGDSLNVEFNSSANRFQFSLSDGHWDSTHSGDPGFQLSPDGKLLMFSATSLQELKIDATSSTLGGLTPLSVTDSSGGIAVGHLTILGARSVVLDSTANDFDLLAISAGNLDLFDSDEVSIQSLDIQHDFTLTAAETITDAAGATISVGGHAQIVGSSLVLGDDASDSIHFGSLSFHATGAVSITEADDTVLSGSSTADSLTLHSAGSLTDDGTADLQVNDLAHFDADAIELDDTYHFRSLTASSKSGGISISESDDMSLSEITSAADIHLSSGGDIHLTADSHVFAGYHAEITLTAATEITIGHGASIHAAGGNVLIDAGPHGDLYASGTIDVSDLEPGEIGGTVHLLGERVALLDGAIVNSSGDAGGGTVLIGGDYQGANVAIHNAAQSFVGSSATISADAISTGNGGRVVIWSNNNTEFFGMLSARGAKDGHGGFAEVSGKDLLTFAGRVDLTGQLGGGTLLLDPKNITIADTATPDVRTSNDAFGENPGSSVTFDADTITAVTNTGAAVVLQASNDITINESIITNRPAGAGGAMTLQAGRSVIINANITTDDAALSITANETLAKGVVNANRDPAAAAITMASGTTILAGTGNITIVMSTGAGLTNRDSGDLTIASITSAGVVTLTNNGTTAGSDILSASASSLISAATLNLTTDSGTIGDSILALQFDVSTLTANSSAANSAQYLSEVNTVAIGTTGLNAGTGTVTLSSGTFSLPAANRINDSTTLAIDSGASFQMKGFSETIGGLNGAGTVENESGLANTSTLTVSNAAANTFSGMLRNGDGIGTDGTLALTKSAAATLILSGSNTYTGATIVSGGTVQLDGTIDANFTSSATVAVSGTGTRLTGTGTINNAVTVSTNATLGGRLNITGPVTINSTGTLSPGNSPGIISTGNLSLASGSTFTVEIDDNNTVDPLVTPPGAVAGTDYDQVQVTGSVTIGATAKLNLQDLGSTGINPRDVYVIIDNDGSADAVSGTFGSVIGVTDINGGTLASGDLLDLNGDLFRIFYNGGDGNDIVLIGRPAMLPDVFVSNSFVGLIPGALISDVNFIAGGAQPGVYGIDGFATVAEGVVGVDTNGVIHVDQGTFLHTGTLQVNRSVTIDGQGMDLTQILKSGAPTGNFDEAIRISADNVTLSDVKLGWQVHSTTVSNPSVDYRGYVVVTTADNTTISLVLFGDKLTGEGYRSAVVFEGTAGNGADGLEVSDSIFEGRWGRGVIRDGDAGSGENFLITRNEFREDHFRWGPIAIGPQDSAGTPNNFAFSGEISFNYFGNGLDTVDFQELGNQNFTVTITNQALTAAGLQILHNTFDWNDSNVINQTGNYAQPAGVYITPALTGNASQILIQNNIFNNFAYAGPQPGTTDPQWRPTGGVFGGALEFDGADDFGVWQSSLFDVGTAGTLNFWVQMHDTSRRNQFFEGPGNAGFEMQYRNTSGGQVYGRATTVGGDNVIRSGPDGATLLNTWHNIQYTWDFNAINATGRMRIYIDGAQSGYLTGSTPNDLTWATVVSTVNGLMNVGRDPGDTSRYFDGLMDDVGWFNSVLTAVERTNIQNNGVAALSTDSRLVAHWDFDQATGQIAVDNKNGIGMFISTDGIVPFGPTYQAGIGQFGGALQFDGADDFATFQDPNFDVGDHGTLNFWVNMDDTTRRNEFFEGPGNAGFEMQYRNNSGGQVYGRTDTGGDFVIRSGGDAATLNSGWHNIQYTWDFTTKEMRIYINGTQSGYLANFTPTDLNWTAVTDTVNGLMNVGRDPGDVTRYFDGLMDDIAWYNDVLSTVDLAAIRTTGVSARTDLVAHWAFDTAPTIDNTYLGDSGTGIVLYLQQLPPSPPVSGYGVVTPAAAVVLNNVFFNDVASEYADSNQVLAPGNLIGPTANPFFKGDDPNVPFAGTTLAEFYRPRWGSSAAFQSTEFQADIATMIPHIGANQEDPVAFGVEDIQVAGTDFDDLVVLTFSSDNDGFFTFTRNVTGASPEFVGSFNFVDITSFTFDGYGGDDVFIIVQPTATQGGLFSLVNGITFNAGTQNSDGNALNSDGGTGGDTLVLLTSATDQAVLDSANYVFGNDDPIERHSGTITLTDGLLSTVIAFNGTEPIRDELSVNARTFAFASTIAGGAETITVSTPGNTVAMTSTTFMGDEIKPQVTSRTLDNRIQSTLGPSASFANSNTQLTINAGSGNDIVNINSIHANFHSALTINGGGGIDRVNLNASLTLGNSVVGNTGNLTVTSEAINMAATVAINTTAETTGDGYVLLTADSNVTLGAGSTITTSTGYVLTMTSNGPIDVDGMITTGSGNVLLMANGSLRNIALDADIISSSGHITLMAANTINIGPLVDIQTAGAGTITIEAAADSVTMNTLSTVSTVNGDIRVKANNDVTVSRISASNANVSLVSALGSILDADADDTDTDIIALGLRIQAAVGIGTLGAGSNAIETTVSKLSVRAAGGGINVLESNGLAVDDVTVTTQKVQTDGMTLAVTDATQSDLVSTGDGSIVLRSQAGNLTLNDGTATSDSSAINVNGTGNLLLQTLGSNGDLIINAKVSSGTGNLTLVAADDIDINANLSTTGAGTVYLLSGNGAADTITGIDMAAGTSITTGGGNVRLSATGESDIRLGVIDAGNGDVSLIAERHILNGGVALNVVANDLRMVADANSGGVPGHLGMIGKSDVQSPRQETVNREAIGTNVNFIAAKAAEGIYIHETNSIDVSTTGDASGKININGVTVDSTTTLLSDNFQSLEDLRTSANGPIKLVAEAGTITLNGGGDTAGISANGTGDVLLEARGGSSDVIVNATIQSGTGHVTLNAGDDIDLNANVTTGGGTVYLLGSNGTQTDAIRGIAMQNGTAIISGGGNVRLVADNESDLRLGLINAGTGTGAGAVSLIAERSILDNNGAELNVQANVLRMVADASMSNTANQAGIIGGSATGNGTPAANVNAIDTQVTTLAAQSADGIYVREQDGLTVQETGSILVQHVNFNSTRTDGMDASLSDLTTTDNGPIKLQSVTGSIKLNEGDDADDSTVSANGTGDVLIQTLTVNGDIIVNSNNDPARVMSGSGHITLHAGDDIDLNANVGTSGAGTVYLMAANGTPDLTGPEVNGISINGSVTTQNGDVLVDSMRDIRQTAVITSTRGNIGLIANRNISQLDNGDVTSGGGDVLVEAGLNWTMSSGAVITGGGGEFDGKAIRGDIALGFISAAHVALTAGSDIRDANGTALNVEGETLSLRSGGLIGNKDSENNNPGANINAIDTHVDTLAASSAGGIYILEADGLTIDTVSALTLTVDAPQQVNFNSTLTPVPQKRDTEALEDLTTSADGPIKVVTNAGSITVNAGTAEPTGVTANGTGDVLLEARGTGSDVILNSDVRSGTGEITLNAARSVLIGDDVSTAGTGSIFVVAIAGSVTVNDADVNLTGVSTQDGDILLEAAMDITLNSELQSVAGDIGIQAGNDLLQNADITAGGDVLLAADQDITMAGSAVTSANGGELLYDAGRNISVGLVQATNVSMSAGADITDSRLDLTTNIRATNFRMVAGGAIGGRDPGSAANTNTHAIDTEVVNLAAASADGTHIQEVAAGGAVIVRDIAAVTVTVSVDQANFNSTSSTVTKATTLSGLADLTTTSNGDIKLVAANGSITIQDGSNGVANASNQVGVSAHGSGDVLLEARGNVRDVVVNANILSGLGHVTLNAGDDIHLNAKIATAEGGTVFLVAANVTPTDVAGPKVNGINIDGTITTVNGDVLIESAQDVRQTAAITSASGDIGIVAARDVLQTNSGDTTSMSGDVLVNAARDWTMGGDARISVGGQDILGQAGRTITLGVISMTSAAFNRVALSADGSIVDANAASVNIEETISRSVTSVSLRAGGRIGAATTMNGTPNTNGNAIDLNIDQIAAVAPAGIYLREIKAGGSITVQNVAAVTVTVDGVRRSNFNSSISPVSKSLTLSSLEDLTSTSNGPVKLVAEGGTITVRGGVDSSGIRADGAGDILLEARGATSDVVVQASVHSDAGHVSLTAGDDIDLTSTLSTGGTGTVYLLASNGNSDPSGVEVDGINLDARITTTDGDVLLHSMRDIRQTSLVNSTSGDVGLIASRNIEQTATGDITTATGDVMVDAGGDWTMGGDATIAAGGQDVLGQAVGTIRLGVISLTNSSINRAAFNAGGSILDANGAGVNIQETNNAATTSLSLRAGNGMIGQAGGPIESVNNNAIDLNVDTVAARAANGIYLRELAAGGAIEVNTAPLVKVQINDVVRANFNSTTSDVSQVRIIAVLEDLTTTANGPIKLVAESGTITVNAGAVNTPGVSAGGNGDVLLEARGAASDVIINADVFSGTGHITLDAADDVEVNDILTTGGAGTVFITAADNDATGLNGISLNATVTTENGDVLLKSADDIIQNAVITSTSGDIGLIATDNIEQTVTGNISTLSGDVLVDAGGDWTMNGASTITAGGQDVLGQAGGTIRLGVISLTSGDANRVALSTGVSILDANGASVNIEETHSASVTSVSLRAGSGAIGTLGGAISTVNNNAIDLNVDTVAASSNTGIYLRQIAAGGAIQVNTAAAVTVDINDVVRANFSSTTSDVSQDRTLAVRQDLTTRTNGPIKLVAESGTVMVNTGTDDMPGVRAGGSGDVLLEARGAASDVIINADVLTGTGHITLNAADDVNVRDGLTTGGAGTIFITAADNDATGLNGINLDATLTTENGDVLLTSADDIIQNALITSASGDIGLIAIDKISQTATSDINTLTGDVLIDAGGDWTMDGDATITAGGQDVLGQAGGTIHLGVISVTNATANRVALGAGNSILDANGAGVNIQETNSGAATSVSLRAGSGSIGQADAGNNSSMTNNNAIDLKVDTIAASSNSGIYLRELAMGGAIQVDRATAVSVDINDVVRANFNSTTTDVSQDRMLAGLEDLITRANGPIKLVAEAGRITVNGGNDTSGISANGTGDVLLEARGAASDVIVNADVVSGMGHITLDAGDDIDLNARLITGGPGTVYLVAANGTSGDATGPEVDGINLDGSISTVNGDVLAESSQDIRQTALVTSISGNIGLVAAHDITQTATGDITTTTSDVFFDAGRDWTMNGTTVITVGGQDVLGRAGGNITLGVLSLTNTTANRVALHALNGRITDANAGSVNIQETVSAATTSVSLRARTIIGGAGGTQSATNTQALDLNVDTVAVMSATGIYLKEIATGGAIQVGMAAAVTVNLASVVRSDFDSGTTSVTQSRSLAALEDLTTTSDGPIKLVAEAGTITLNGGADTAGISTNGTGAVLLESRGRSSDVIVNATIQSGTGHVTLDGGRHVDVNAAVTTGGGGTLYIVSGQNTDFDALLTTASGDVLIEAGNDLSQMAVVTSASGDIGLIAGGTITQSATGDITTTGDVFVDAGRDWTMNGTTVITAGGQDVLGRAGGNIRLGVLSLTNTTANRVALEAVNGSITDANLAGVNIQETVSGAITSVSLRAGTIIGSAGGTTSATNTQALDLIVDTVAALSGTIAIPTASEIYLRELATGGPIEVNTAAAVTVTIADVVRADFDSMTTGVPETRTLASLEDLMTSANGPIKLVAEAGTITLNGGTDTAGISANGTGDVLLEARGGASNVIVNANVVSGGGDIVVLAERDLIVRRDILSVNGIEDHTSATGESILLESLNGNVTIDATAGPIRISTDENPGRSNAVTGDQVSVVADSNNSVQNDEVKFIGDVTLSTDGGVATNFAPRPAVGQLSTAFFVYSGKPLPLAVDAVPTTFNGINAYLYGFNVLIGVAGEENLTVDVDWQDPVNEPGVISNAPVQSAAGATGIDNAVSSERIQQFLVAGGGQLNTVGHVYTALDFTVFQSVQNRTTIIVDFSVSHHSSLNVTGSVIEQFGATQVVPGRDITSTDNVLTGNNQFEGGIASFRIPTVTTAPLAFFYTEPGFATDRPTITAAFESNAGTSQQVVTDFGSGAAGSSASSTDVYFQIRRQYESDRPAETVVERITDSQLISSREAFEKYVRQTPELQDGAGYEIWLISETGGQKVERPIVEFEITGGQPGPANETLPDSSEPPRLEDLKFEQPVEDNNAAVEEPPQALIMPKSDAVIGSTSPSDILPADVSHPAAEDNIVETTERETSRSLNDVAVAVSQLAAPTGTIMSVAVSRFRSQVRESGADDRKLTRAARFVRRHS